MHDRQRSACYSAILAKWSLIKNARANMRHVLKSSALMLDNNRIIAFVRFINYLLLIFTKNERYL